MRLGGILGLNCSDPHSWGVGFVQHSSWGYTQRPFTPENELAIVSLDDALEALSGVVLVSGKVTGSTPDIHDHHTYLARIGQLH